MRIIFPKLRFFLLSTSLLLFFFPTVNAQQIEWVNDLDRAQMLARQSGKPILYDFTAAWCGPCKRMDKEFWPKPEVVELSKQFVCVKVNYDKEKVFARKYGISGIPNVVFTDPWGRGLLGQKGYGSGTDAEILEKVRILPKDYKSLVDAGNALAADEKNLDALHRFAAFYQEKKLFWIGNEYYRRLVLLEAEPSKREMILLNLAFNHIRVNEPVDAIEKLQALQKEFPGSGQNDLYLYGMIVANANKNLRPEASQLANQLKAKFPKSQYVALAEQIVSTIPELKR